MGKGSGRRNEDTQKVWDNWDIVFGKKNKEIKDIKEETHEKKSTETEQSNETK